VSDYQLFHGDCLDVMAGMEDNSIDSIVCDPPAGISFMGKKWDGDKGGRNAWIAWMASIAAECLASPEAGRSRFRLGAATDKPLDSNGLGRCRL
jgi:DNA modification methylase